jgi:predicted amino acid dehydrogenase
MTLAEEQGEKMIGAAVFFSILQAKPLTLFGVIDNRETGKSEPKENDRILRTDDSDPDSRFQLIMKEFWEKIERYVAEIKSGNFSTINSSFTKCVSCSYHTVCRTTYRVRGEPEMLTQRSADD